MNSQLVAMLAETEGRYLDENESAAVRAYAMGLRGRVEAARRLEALESSIVEAAADRFYAKQPAQAKLPDGRAKTLRDYRLTLRYAAGAHVRDDAAFFRRHYAEWIGELLRDLAAPEVLVPLFESLRDAAREQLAAADARVFVPFLETFIEELAR